MSLAEALNSIPQGVVLLDDAGDSMFVNAVAASYAARNDGFSLDEQGVFPLADLERYTLAGAVTDALQHERKRVVPITAGATIGYFVEVRHLVPSPAQIRRSVRRPAVAQLIHSVAGIPQSEASTLRALFGLSGDEIRLTNVLVRGGSLNEAASELGLTYDTARSCLKSIFRKTAVRRQKDLVVLVKSIPLGLSADQLV